MKRATYKKMKQLGWDRFVEAMVSQNIHVAQANLPFVKQKMDTFFGIMAMGSSLERDMYKANRGAAASFKGLASQLGSKK